MSAFPNDTKVIENLSAFLGREATLLKRERQRETVAIAHSCS